MFPFRKLRGFLFLVYLIYSVKALSRGSSAKHCLVKKPVSFQPKMCIKFEPSLNKKSKLSIEYGGLDDAH